MDIIMEKHDGRYHYEPYSALGKPNNRANSPKHKEISGPLKSAGVGMLTKGRRNCCARMGFTTGAFWTGLLTNLGICFLLLAYTLLGSFIFLALEGDTPKLQKTLASTTRKFYRSSQKNFENMSFSPNAILADSEVRKQAVENIWDITVSLNILYKENWTRLAALEIERFQDQLMKRFSDDVSSQLEASTPSTNAIIVASVENSVPDFDWTFARSFLYSLTVLTTIGYGTIAPRTTMGRIVTLAYALLGIPLTLVYLSSTGGVLARVARGVFSRALCCCLCSNCGYCCYDEKRMEEKERRMKRKRQQEELIRQMTLQEPYYVRSGSLHNNFDSPKSHIPIPEMDLVSTSESRISMHGLSLMAPIFLCISMMIIYIFLGAVALYRLENWPLLDGVYFCFMSLSTIGFGDFVPGLTKESTATTWFCSIYIMSGMALTAMCFNVLHQEIIYRMKHVVSIKKPLKNRDDPNDYLAF